MSENPFVCLFQNLEKISNSIQTHLSTFIARHGNPSQAANNALFSVSSSPKPSASSPNFQTFGPEAVLKKVQAAAPVTKGELGRATWTFLHTLAAQYPDKPTRQQKKDVKELMAILSRMYPCQECADHFKEILRANPVQAGSHTEFSHWLCHVHNVVNRSGPGMYDVCLQPKVITTKDCFDWKKNHDESPEKDELEPRQVGIPLRASRRKVGQA